MGGTGIDLDTKDLGRVDRNTKLYVVSIGSVKRV